MNGTKRTFAQIGGTTGRNRSKHYCTSGRNGNPSTTGTHGEDFIYTLICSITMCDSEKKDKRAANRLFRRTVKSLCKERTSFET